MTLTTQQSGFRQPETEQLFKWMQAGESASIIGISGVGKSNLFNHIRDPQTQAQYLGELNGNTIIIRANFHYVPDFSDRSIYSLILEQLEMLDSDAERLGITPQDIEKISQYHEMLLDSQDDILKVQRYFKLALRILLGQPAKRRLVFLFDQFDDVYQEAEERLFANLRGLREAYKYRISYLVFTRDLIPNLLDLDAAREEFYELLASNVMGLKPYARRDAMSVLERVASRNQFTLIDELRERLYALAGGHAGLLRAALLAVAHHNLNQQIYQDNAVAELLNVPGVDMECDKLWRSLSTLEQKTLMATAQGITATLEDTAVPQLQIKGLLTEGETAVIFSPIFARFIKTQDALWERPLYFDEASRQIWVVGSPAPRLTQLEYRLFQQLYQQAGEVVEKDELISAGWPSAKGGVSDEALIAAIARLRKKIEPDPKNPRFLENVHNQGYMLKIE